MLGKNDFCPEHFKKISWTFKQAKIERANIRTQKQKEWKSKNSSARTFSKAVYNVAHRLCSCEVTIDSLLHMFCLLYTSRCV